MKNFKNNIKKIIPSDISCKIKRIEMLKIKERPSIDGPKIFNEYGEQMKNFFLCDAAFKLDYSATKGRFPRHIFWDRNRYDLKQHFYTDDMMFTQIGKPVKKFGMLLEPESLQPKKYKTILSDLGRFLEYEIIFTHSEELLDRLPNAKPLIMGGVYVGTQFGGGEINTRQFEKKTKNISLVSSSKRLCHLHELRYQLALRYENSNIIDCYGNFNGGDIIPIWNSLANYRYSLAIENCIEPYWITERICNCFATMTIPIYLGSPKIGEFFNMNGIINITEKDLDNIDKILERCNEKDYFSRLDAILDNFERVKSFYCLEDWLYNQYNEYFL